MIKKTLYFGNPGYLSLWNSQIQISIPSRGEKEPPVTIPIEDIAYIILDNNQITLTQALIAALLKNDVALITCDERHMPVGLMLPLDGHSLQSERFIKQINASMPLKKQLWRQTIQAKLANQAALLKSKGVEVGNMMAWVEDVRSGDTTNLEARGAVYYWKNLVREDFLRDREGDYPNNFFNYGYAILRAIVARALVSSGLLATLGIHHHNRYNAYCLADDIMEPYRPIVDKLVLEICEETEEEKLTTDIKKRLLSIPVLDVNIDGHNSPLMVAVANTVSSLVKCFSGEARYIIYPTL